MLKTLIKFYFLRKILLSIAVFLGSTFIFYVLFIKIVPPVEKDSHPNSIINNVLTEENKVVALQSSLDENEFIENSNRIKNLRHIKVTVSVSSEGIIDTNILQENSSLCSSSTESAPYFFIAGNAWLMAESPPLERTKSFCLDIPDKQDLLVATLPDNSSLLPAKTAFEGLVSAKYLKVNDNLQIQVGGVFWCPSIDYLEDTCLSGVNIELSANKQNFLIPIRLPNSVKSAVSVQLP